ncbi:MAG TPA: AAA family ATPase [Pseudohongiella sp.]|nr:AAA family ATPase [Gammaproteobacteria bacterium]HBN14328.1 AAA family ATPase [Pseudohongiella sp.]
MTRHKLSAAASTSQERPLPAIVKRWILRIMVPLKGYRQLLTFHGFSDDALAEAIGLGEWLDPAIMDLDAEKILSELKALAHSEEKGKAPALPSSLQRNINKLATLAGLSRTDCSILAFAVMIENHELLESAADLLERVSTSELCRILSHLLEIPESEIRHSLQPQGLLARSGLLTVDRSGAAPFSRKFDLLSQSFADTIFSADAEPVYLLRDVLVPASPAKLQWQDYAHVVDLMSILQSYMANAVPRKLQGVNILIHGLPGTGKSQLARVLAQHLNRDLFEVAFADESGDPINGDRRLRAYRAAQCFFANRDVLLVFDEAEDVLDGSSLFSEKRTQSSKAWINRTLEDNPVPAIWLSNAVDCVDDAVIRRFDMVIELPIPSRNYRNRIVKTMCGEILSENEIAQLSLCSDLSPAIVENAISVASIACNNETGLNSAQIIRSVLNGTLTAQGHRPIADEPPSYLPDVYDPTLINCETDLLALCRNLKICKSARLCLTGSPGTGKTAYAKWLARELDQPIIVKKASDLLGMFVGQTEQNIAAAFSEAKKEGAVLVIDEVDSMLQDRRSVTASWEVSMVNELLTQLESFDGVFIASTNLMGHLDQAALRRFDLKLHFDFLTPEQSEKLLERYCHALKLANPTPASLISVRTIANLTPGDFMTVARRHRFLPIKSPMAFVDALHAESGIKGGVSRSIGFIH